MNGTKEERKKKIIVGMGKPLCVIDLSKLSEEEIEVLDKKTEVTPLNASKLLRTGKIQEKNYPKKGSKYNK